MQFATLFVVATFITVYIGMALGRWPGLKIDRTGIAELGAIALYSTGLVSNAMLLQAINFPTLIVLFGLMVLPAQFAACGFSPWFSARIAATHASPVAILALTVSVAGALSAVLANDVVVFAMTSMLIDGLSRRGLDPAALFDRAGRCCECAVGCNRYRQPAEYSDRAGRTARFLSVCSGMRTTRITRPRHGLWRGLDGVAPQARSDRRGDGEIEISPMDRFGVGKDVHTRPVRRQAGSQSCYPGIGANR